MKGDQEMQVKKSEYDAIAKALELLPSGVNFKELNAETQNIILNADNAMLNILRRKKDQNRKTADYIAEKRKTNKNYARKVKK